MYTIGVSTRRDAFRIYQWPHVLDTKQTFHNSNTSRQGPYCKDLLTIIQLSFAAFAKSRKDVNMELTSIITMSQNPAKSIGPGTIFPDFGF